MEVSHGAPWPDNGFNPPTVVGGPLNFHEVSLSEDNKIRVKTCKVRSSLVSSSSHGGSTFTSAPSSLSTISPAGLSAWYTVRRAETTREIQVQGPTGSAWPNLRTAGDSVGDRVNMICYPKGEMFGPWHHTCHLELGHA